MELKLVEFELALKKWGVKVPALFGSAFKSQAAFMRFEMEMQCAEEVAVRVIRVTGCHLSEVDNVVHFFAHIDEDYSGSISVEAAGGEPTTALRIRMSCSA